MHCFGQRDTTIYKCELEQSPTIDQRQTFIGGSTSFLSIYDRFEVNPRQVIPSWYVRFSLILHFPAGRARLCEPMGAGKPTFPQPGGPSGQASRLRESLCTPQGRLPAERGGHTLSKGPWVVAHPRSWCQGWDRRGKFRVWRRPVSPAYVSPIWVCRARLAGRRAGSDVAVHPHDSPTSDLGWYHGRVEL